MIVKFWFIQKQFEGLQKELAQMYEPEVIRKTEKGFLLEWNIPGRGSFRSWAPKGACEAN